MSETVSNTSGPGFGPDLGEVFGPSHADGGPELVQRFVGEWAREELGPDFRIHSCALRLGAPAYPYDTLAFSGTVTEETDGVLSVDVLGAVSLGNHVNATVKVSAS